MVSGWTCRFCSSHLFFSCLSALVKAVNTAVDLIVAHFGTSRNPDVKVDDAALLCADGPRGGSGSVRRNTGASQEL